MLSLPHLIIIFLVALIVFGPEKIPELARGMGKIMGEFRRATGDLRSGFEEHMRELEREAEVAESRKRAAARAAAESKAETPALPEQSSAESLPVGGSEPVSASENSILPPCGPSEQSLQTANEARAELATLLPQESAETDAAPLTPSEEAVQKTIHGDPKPA